MLSVLAKFGSKIHIMSISPAAAAQMKYSDSKSFFFHWSNNTTKPSMIKNSVAYAIALLSSFKDVEDPANPMPTSTTGSSCRRIEKFAETTNDII